MGKFIKIVLIIYVIYYAAMIIFDLFIKKSIGTKKNDDEMNLQIEGFQTQNVEMTEEELAIEERLQQEEKRFEDEEDEDDEEPEPVNEDSVEMEVDGQGFTMDKFSEVMEAVHHESENFMTLINTIPEQANNSI